MDGFLGPVMNPYEEVSCQYIGCISQLDCSDNNVCVTVNPQLQLCMEQSPTSPNPGGGGSGPIDPFDPMPIFDALRFITVSG